MELPYWVKEDIDAWRNPIGRRIAEAGRVARLFGVTEAHGRDQGRGICRFMSGIAQTGRQTWRTMHALVRHLWNAAKDTAMETPVIRDEVEAFLRACQSFMGFTQYTLLTTAEHKAVADLVRKLGMGSNPSPDDPPSATTRYTLPPID